MSPGAPEPERSEAIARERRLDEIVTEYLDAARAGRRPARDDLLARHPEMRKELEDFLETLERLGEVSTFAPPLDAGPAAFRAGRTFGDYELLEEIGRGGMGVVYKARQRSLNRTVALKVLLAGSFASEVEQLRFVREAEAAASLEHPCIVPIFEIGQEGGQRFFSMRWVDGGTLAGDFASFTSDPRRAAELMASLAEAVGYAHQRGVLHRDLKPSNILLDHDRQPLITDFGLARRVDSGTLLTRTGAVLGTPSYMAPEQAEGRHTEVAAAADIYSLGAILYEILTCRPPFAAGSSVATLRRVIEEEPARPRSIASGIPLDLESICLKCLEKSAAARYTSAEALALDLRRFLAHEPVVAHKISKLERAWRWCRRHRAVTAVWALLVAIAAGASSAALLLQRASVESERRLWDSYVAQAQGVSQSDDPDRRRKGLQAVRSAAAIRPSPDLRDEAVACVALTGLEPVNEWLAPDEDTASALDPRFERFASSNPRGEITIYHVPPPGAADPEMALRAEKIITLAGPDQAASRLSFSTDGRFLAAVHGALDNAAVRVWDTGSARLIFSTTTNMSGHGRTLDFHPHAARLAVATADRAVSIFHLDGDNEGETIYQIPPRQDPPVVIRYAPDGDRLAISFDNPHLEIHSLETGEVTQLTAPQLVYHVAWHPSGQTLAVATSDSVVYLCDLATRRMRPTEDRHQKFPVTTVAFDSRGRLLVSTGWDGSLHFWSPLSGNEDLVSQKGAGADISFRHDDRQFASLGFPGRCTVWNITWSDVYRRFSRAEEFACLLEPRLVACVESATARFREVESGREIAAWSALRVERLRSSPDGRILLTKAELPSGGAGLFLSPVSRQESAGSISLRIGPPRFVLALRQSWFDRFSFSADGKALALALGSSGNGPYAAVIATEPPEEIRILVEHAGVNSVSLSPGGEWLATAAFGGRDVKIWDARTAELQQTFPLGKGGVAFSPDGAGLLVMSGLGFTLYRTGSWETVWRVPKEDPYEVPSLGVFDPRGNVVALCVTRRTVSLHDAATGRKLAALRGPNPSYFGDWLIAFDAGGTQLWTGRRDGSIEVWDLRALRAHLDEMGLDWEQSPLPPQAPSSEGRELTVEIDPGELKEGARPAIGAAELNDAVGRWREKAHAR